MSPIIYRHASAEDDIPLVERPRSTLRHEDHAVTQSMRPKPLPASVSLPRSIPPLPQRCSPSYSQVPEHDDSAPAAIDHMTSETGIRPARDESIPRDTPGLTWVPYALRPLSLLALFVLNVALLATVIAIHAKSVTSLGLVTDDGSASIVFAWRFAPTLITVIYVVFWMILVDNINRTEAFARLSKFHDSSAPATVLRAPGPWWSALADSFARQKNDRRPSLVLFSAVVGYVLGFLILSPFPAALLISRDVIRTDKVEFLQPRIDQQSSLQPALDTSTFFRTIANIMQNVTTSAWISEKYTVVPFWPSGLERPLGAQLSDASQTWRANGLVLQTELSCESMNLIRGPNPQEFKYGDHDPSPTDALLYTLVLSSRSGCEYGFASASWSRANDPRVNDPPAPASHWSGRLGTFMPQVLGSHLVSFLSDNDGSVSDENWFMNFTQACGTGYVIVSFTKSEDKAFTATGQLCSSQFFAANVSIDAVLNDGVSLITFDETEYRKIRRPVMDSMINVTGFQSSFLQAKWSSHLRRGTSAEDSFFGGPASLLAALYDFRITDMMADMAIGNKASIIHQRAFGETLQSSLKDVSTLTTVPGEIITRQRRVVVVQPVAIILEVGLILHLFFLTIILLRGQQRQRSLGLSRDSVFTNTITALVSSHQDTQTVFRKLFSVLSIDLPAALDGSKFTLHNGVLKVSRVIPTESSPHPQFTKPSTRLGPSQYVPRILSIRLVSVLCSFIAAILIAIAVLYWYSLDHGLHQKVFVYQTRIKIADNTLGTLAPYSVIPTLIAVAISLWWGAIESLFRTVQPYITMAKGTTSAHRGTGVSYQSSYLFWAAFRALHRKHWLLTLICLGTFATQILTISMSSIWQRQPSNLTLWVEARQPLELRQIPLLTLDVDSYKDVHVNKILASLFKSFKTSWMYGASVQLTLNGSEPVWSKDGWNFVPLDLSDLVRDELKKGLKRRAVDEPQLAVNVAVQSPAVRARLECDQGAYIDDCWMPNTEYFAKSTKWKEATDPSRSSTMYHLDDRIVFSAYNSAGDRTCSPAYNNTSVLPQQQSPRCCPQGSKDNPGTLSIGYWTPYGSESPKFNIKWMHGLAQNFDALGPELFWLEKPRLAIANCTAVIEKANASVTVDLATGTIQGYIILDEPTPDTNAWAEPFVQRVPFDGGESGFFNRNVTTSFGPMFLQALLRASQVNNLMPCWTCNSFVEDINDNTYNFREPGLNMDYMSYSMLSLANNDRTALLDPNRLVSLAQRTFTTFFQHFASSGVSVDGDGGWVYQRVNASLPSDLMPPYDYLNITVAPTKSSGLTKPVVSVQVTRPVEMLHMSPIAVWLSISILAWLLVTTVLIMVVKKRYFSPLRRGVNTFADIAIMVASSERYLSLAKERGMAELQDKKDFSTRLGWFWTSSGEARWGIELVDDSVEWLSEEEVKALEAEQE